MASRGYCTVADVEAALGGRNLDATQEARADKAIEAAENWADAYTGRVWLGNVTDELHLIGASRAVEDDPDRGLVSGGRTQSYPLYLRRRPVASVTSVKVRTRAVDAADDTLATSAWELLDSTRGLLLISGYGDYYAKVTYTVSGTVPMDLTLGVAELAAWWLTSYLQPEQSGGVKQIAVGNGDLSLTFTDLQGSYGIPDAVLARFRHLRLPVLA